MNNWKIFDETSLPDKETFYSSDVDYKHEKIVLKKIDNENIYKWC